MHDIKSAGRRLRFAIGAVAIACIGPSAAHALQPLTDAENDELNRMTAASPQRELYRSAVQCIGNTGALMLPQGRAVDEIDHAVAFVCQDELSRLAGALVREFGYERGNRVMRLLERVTRQALEQRVARRDQPNSNAVQGISVPEGWTLQRAGRTCAVTHIGGSMFAGTTGTGIRVTNGQALLILMQIGSSAAREAGQYPEGAQLRVTLYRYVNMSGEVVGPVTLSVVRDQEGLVFTTPLTEDLMARISEADTLQFRASPSGEGIVPKTFDVRGLSSALAAARRCAA